MSCWMSPQHLDIARSVEMMTMLERAARDVRTIVIVLHDINPWWRVTLSQICAFKEGAVVRSLSCDHDGRGTDIFRHSRDGRSSEGLPWPATLRRRPVLHPPRPRGLVGMDGRPVSATRPRNDSSRGCRVRRTHRPLFLFSSPSSSPSAASISSPDYARG